MKANYTAKSIGVIIRDNKTGGGMFFLELPRKVIDANSSTSIGCSEQDNNDWTNSWLTHDLPYQISVTSAASGKPASDYLRLFEGKYAAGGELCDHYIRTLNVYYPAGKTIILIQATVMVPEFPPFVPVLIMVRV